MRFSKILVIAGFLLGLCMTGALAQQSPPGTAETVVNGKKVSIAYSRPSMRGRKIMGELVPYDKVWRTGANKSTEFKTEASLTVGNTVIPAGSYTIYSLPSATGWKLIINKQTGQWGTEYDQSKDLARIDMKVGKTAGPVEQFTITLTTVKSVVILKLEWENTSATVGFTAK